jgi:hypothetical protein
MPNMLVPKSNGRWDNPKRPGDAVWFPDLSNVPARANHPLTPYTFRQLLFLQLSKPLNLGGICTPRSLIAKTNILRLALGLRGIRFCNNEPDFSPFAIATVKLKPILDIRYGSEGTMSLADKTLANQLGISESKLRKWINDNQYVWHERQNGIHIDLLCHDIHGNISHTGGIAMNKMRLGT